MDQVLESAEIQIDTVGVEAVRQTLDALGIQTEPIHSAGSESTPGPTGATTAPGGPSQASPSSPGTDLAGVLAAIARSNEILERIAAAVETPPPPPPRPTY